MYGLWIIIMDIVFQPLSMEENRRFQHQNKLNNKYSYIRTANSMKTNIYTIN